MSFHYHRIFIGLVILLPFYSLASFFSGAALSVPINAYKTDIWSIETTPTLRSTVTPFPTQIVIFPLVKQDRERPVSLQVTQVLSPTLQHSKTPTPTITPTYIPPQDSSTNMPIVFGAMVIVIVVVGTWFFVTRSELTGR
jgi:hypothetical protein